MPLFWLDSPRFFMQIHVVDSIFGLLEIRFVTFFSILGRPGGCFFGAVDPVWSPPQAPGVVVVVVVVVMR